MAQQGPPERPVAVYRLYDTTGALLYVGATVDPATRLKSHCKRFGSALDPASMTLEWYATRAEADAAEADAIIAEQPRGNHDGVKRQYRAHRMPSFPPKSRPPYVAPGRHMTEDDLSEPGYTVKDLVKLLGVRSETVRRYIAEGKFPNAWRMTPGPKGVWRIPRADVIAWRNRGRQSGPS